MFDVYLRDWGLEVDGEVAVTPRAKLLPVTYAGQPAMLKVALFPNETVGNAVLAWWDGQGAARVLAADGAAVLLERAATSGSLLKLYQEGRDEECIEVIADVAAALHAPRHTQPPPGTTTLAEWFVGLESAAERLGGALHASAKAAATLLASSADDVVLHGDLHHDNILYFGDRGWLAIDPKGVRGERTFDYVPQLLDPDDATGLDVARLERQLALTAAAGAVDAGRLRLWLLAWAGLTAAWWSDDGKSPAPSLRVAEAVASNVAPA